MDITALLITAVLFLLVGAALGWLIGAARTRSGYVGQLAEARTAQRLLTDRTAVLEADARLATELTSAVGPLAAGVKSLHTEVGRHDRERIEQITRLSTQIAALTEQNQRLQESTGRLSTALHSTAARGSWGEVQLRRIVEYSGMLPHVDFDTQVSVSLAGDGTRGSCPDLVVHIPGGGTIVVDAKTPLSARLRSGEEAPTQGAGDDHARALLRHVDQLASKEYWALFDTAPEFVVCFVPTDGLLSEAAAAYPQLIDRALAKNVVLASPSTLLVLLKTVALNWRQHEISTSAKEVMRLGRELYERTGLLGERLARLGGSLDKAVAEYNGFIGSFESRFLVTARKFPATGVVQDELAAFDQLDGQTRGISAAELASPPELREGGPSRGGGDARRSA
ncbi:DNA recombination protein RmuC [Brevibacterium sp. R8603A2]|uniref:DNA recombination protein RmuC n=1 Tax=Brevibacterium sp. R8603A2 TaxID=2929779 RepID=UPI001FFA57D9|nr:DNA recombination protein RmuC [Brevibacterium sp. R8603A2]MCK1803856.1 DNA recombination protein RmuC [Brevibacterium sp. R8603A2]